MSNFSMYELQGNVWDEFCEADDRVVPNAGDDHKVQFALQAESCKKSLKELHSIKRSTGVVSSYGPQGQEELLPNLSLKERMLEKGSWSQKPEGFFSSCDGDLCKELKTPTSDNTRMSDHLKSSNADSSSVDDAILRDKCIVEDDGLSQYQINDISQTDNDLSFLDNDVWLDIGNFEDVDRALNCDLTFGMGSLNNEEEEFCWLSSSHGAEGSDDALKSDFKFASSEESPLKSMSDYNMSPKENIEGLPTNDPNKKASPIDKKLMSQMNIDHDAGPPPLSAFGESNRKSTNTDNLVPTEKVQGKLSKPSVGKRKNGYLENGDSIHPYSHMEQYPHLKQPFGASSSAVTSQDSIHKHTPNMDSDSLGCVQMRTPLTHRDYNHTPSYTSLLPALSGSRSEHNKQLSPLESPHGKPLEAASLETNDKREKLYNCYDARLLSRGIKGENMASHMTPFPSPGSGQRVGHQFENENEDHSEVGGVSIGFSQEIDSSNAQESPSMSSALDEISLEATSFRQLQQVMDQLDIRTKLCIRDSLYRLAKSAEQRHTDANVNGQLGDDIETRKALMTQGADRCTGFMDVETNTNPIDRSIAHLLFHRPSDASIFPRNDTTPFKSGSMIHGSVINPPVMTENQVCQEGSSGGVEKKPLAITPSKK
ncbi:protein LNK1 isoform X1 [Arachis ipaensis]|nr:protein LNK1 isoform X1 [Arachis ipaensis]XP_020975517.1 protein LNK1 isoform X1 [Arachis ipaensis]XP_025639541.1 protein LNK1 isoform X1 [Arachis hypogaea]XP_029147654.1 protein LNK1 isoform X1 [Arachis hypogaea]QHO59929.1 uncharacterized protein DS421_3g103070 [Arachis hypogaea]